MPLNPKPLLILLLAAQIAIVLEYMNGGSLGDILQKVSTSTAASWAGN